MPRYATDELNDVGEVILISGVVFARVGLEEIVASGHLEGHAGGGPDVGRGTVARTQEHLQTAILPGLNVLGKVVILDKKNYIHKMKNVRTLLKEQISLVYDQY